MLGRNVLQKGGLVEAPLLAIRAAVALRRIAVHVLAAKIQLHVRRRVDALHRMVEGMLGGGEVDVVALRTDGQVAATQATVAPARELHLSASAADDALVAVHSPSSAASVWRGLALSVQLGYLQVNKCTQRYFKEYIN